MPATIDILRPKKVLMIASNAAVSPVTGWPIGVWAAELTHPYWEFVERGYQVDIASPTGGKLQFDGYSDPRDLSGYSAHDLITMGFVNTPQLMAKIEHTQRVGEVNFDHYDAVFVCGGQGPMITMIDDPDLHACLAAFYETGKPLAVICHGTCVLLKTRLSDGSLLVEGKTWTGFADAEEQYAENFVKQRIQPFWIESEARKIPNTNFITNGLFKPFAIRDGNLITGQQQYSGAEAARLVIQVLGQ